jgi:hypothetical protein
MVLRATRTKESAMRTRDLPLRLFRVAMILIAVSCTAAVKPLLAQQAPDAVRVTETSSAQASAPSTAQPGPRLSPQFQRFEPSVAPSNASGSSSLAAAAGSHTIVISTLALVLIVVIIVLLI